jgi:hypothetical protein
MNGTETTSLRSEDEIGGVEGPDASRTGGRAR